MHAFMKSKPHGQKLMPAALPCAIRLSDLVTCCDCGLACSCIWKPCKVNFVMVHRCLLGGASKHAHAVCGGIMGSRIQ